MKHILTCFCWGVFIVWGKAWNNHSGYNLPDPFSGDVMMTQQDTVPKDRKGDFLNDPQKNPFDLKDPEIIQKDVSYDPETGLYIIKEKIGDDYFRAPTYMTFEEYVEYKNKEQQKSYFQKLGGLSSGVRSSSGISDPIADIDVSTSLIDRLFGGNEVEIKPQGNIDLTFGGDYQNVQNPILTTRQQRQGGFDFDMDINLNASGKIGEKLNLNFNYNTQANFDFENQMKLAFDSDQFSEDDIIKKIEAGHVNLPLRSSLIQGSQSLFGLKTELQFGRLKLIGVASQQKSQAQNIQLQDGGQLSEFEVLADQYDENRHFFLSHFNRETFEPTLSNLPQISTLFTITKMEVWITNERFETQNVRDIVAIADLGEADRMTNRDPNRWQMLANPPKDFTGRISLPDNSSNTIYESILNDPMARNLDNAVASLQSSSFQFEQVRDFEKIRARLLTSSEYTYDPQLGFISLNINLRPDQVLAVAYEYVYKGEPYQVGELTSETPGDPDTLSVLYTKLLKATSPRIDLPTWDLMMKNFYNIGAYQVDQEDFLLDVFYDEPGKGFKRFLPAEGIRSVPLITLFNLDNLNTYGDPQPDGIFDFVPGRTIFPQNGRIMFPVLEPFGSSLTNQIGDSIIANQFTFQMLYDSTITLAREFPELNRFVIRGEYKSSGGGSDVSLRSFNVANNSVVVKAGAQVLQEGVHYRVDYNTGRVEITDESIKNSGVPIDIQYEDNNTFGFQNRTMLGLRAEYEVRDNFTIGGTIMRLFERPYTEKVNIGEDPINNGIYGLDINYTNEAPWLTKAVDALPLIQTKAPSSLSFQAEAAALRPGHSRAINLGNDKGGVVYLDDFEGSTNSLDLKTPYNSWVQASVPGDTTLFPEGRFINNRLTGVNRAKMNWYRIDPSVDRAGCDAQNPYLAQITPQEIFPERDRRPGFNTLFTFDLTYYPRERGSYNFDPIGGTDYSAGLRQDNGELDKPDTRWAGIMRSLYTTDFEASNIEYIEFWMLDPFMEKCDDPGISKGGKLYLNLGNISEDIMKDSRKFFENGLPRPQSSARTDTTKWGRIPRVQPLTNAFDNDPAVRIIQDVGLDGLDDIGEREVFGDYLTSINNLSDRQAFARIQDDPSGDNFTFFDDPDFFDGSDGALDRYKFWNNTQGNSQATDQNQTRISSYTNIPDSEDLNRDNTLSESESYYQYEIPIEPDPDGGLMDSKYITDRVDAPGGRTWYRFKIPIQQYDKNVGGIQGFRSIRFMRLFLKGFDERITFRFGVFEFVRNQWRRYSQNLCFGDLVDNSAFDLNEVNVEEHSSRQPFNYLVPKGVQREQLIGAFPNLRQNEQSLALNVCGLIEGCSKAVYKNVQRDLRTYERFKMFVHAESEDQVDPGDLSIFIRIGSDFKNNFYEYEVPITMSDPDLPANDADNVWIPENAFDFALQNLINTKIERNNSNVDPLRRYSILDPDNEKNTITVVGNPNLGNVRSVMIGLMNNEEIGDGQTICAEVWVNEMRVTGINEQGGIAGLARLDLQLADLGNISFAGNFSTIGWGAIDQQVDFRAKESLVEYDINANIDLHKFFGEKSTLRIPVYAQLSNSTSTPQFDPYDEDIELKDKINDASTAFARDSIKQQAIDQTTIKSINFTNVRKEKKNTQSKPKPWDISNFSLTYVYSEKDNHNPIIKKDVIKNHRGSLDYNYNRRAKYVEPFKNLIGDTKVLKFIKDINFNPLPNSFSFRTSVNRTFGEKTYRFSLPQFSTWFNKRFTWDREYQLQWDLTKSLKFNFSAENNAVIDEPDEYLDRFEGIRIDPKVRNDSIWTNLKQLGRNKNYAHNINVSYNLPTRSFPILDWINLRAQVSNSYSWTARALNVDSLGNILQNSQTRNLTADLNFEGLYNKWDYLSKINGKKTNRRTSIRRPAGANAPGKDDDKKDDKKKEKKNREVTAIEKILIRPLMSLRRAKFTYQENLNSVVPGFTPTPELLGLSKGFEAPGWKYALGWHPTDEWLNEIGQKGWISNSPFLNDEVIRNKTQRLDAQITLEPFTDFKIDVNANRNYQENHSQFFRNCNYGAFDFVHQVPRDVGTFTVSYLSLNAIFQDNFQEEIIPRFMDLESTRSVMSGRLGSGTHAKDGPDYTEGFGRYQTEVLIPSFIAVYNGEDANSIKTDVFDILPKPNWQVTYNGLQKLPWFTDFIASFSLTHGYQSTLTVSSYNTDIDYEFDDPFGSQNLNPLTSNYYSKFEIPSVVITEQFAPLIGLDLKAKNGLSARYDYAKSRNVALNLTDYQVIESNSTSTTLGIGYTMQNVNIGFLTGNKKKRKTTRQRTPQDDPDQNKQLNNQPRQARGNDLTITFDYTLRDDITINHIFDQSQNEPTRGLRSISINPSIDYQASDNLNLRLFVDYQRTVPYTSLSYPITSVRGGLTVRISLN